MNSMLHS